MYCGNARLALYVSLSIILLSCKADDDLADALGNQSGKQTKPISKYQANDSTSSANDQDTNGSRTKPVDENEDTGGYLIDVNSLTTQPKEAGIIVSGKVTAPADSDLKKVVIYSTKADRAGLEALVTKGSTTASSTTNYQINTQGNFSFETTKLDAGFLVIQASAEITSQIEYSAGAKASNVVIINAATELSAEDLAQKANSGGMSPNEPDLWISRGPVYDFGSALKAGGQYDVVLTLVNSGSGRAKISSQNFAMVANEGLQLQFSGGSYPGTVPAADYLPPVCAGVLEAGAQCRFGVSFASSVAAKSEGKMTILYTNDAASRSVSVTKTFKGEFIPAATISISDDAADAFQNIAVNSTKSIYVTMFNSGDIEATIQNAEFRDDATGSSDQVFKFFNAAGYPGVGDPTPSMPMCGATLAPSASCRLHIQFAPATAARYSRTLHVSYRYLDKSYSAKRAYIGTTPDAS